VNCCSSRPLASPSAVNSGTRMKPRLPACLITGAWISPRRTP
jgi:hypothetical protein